MLMTHIRIHACVAAFPFALFFDRTVEYVVLCNEDYVKYQADVCQAELDWVSCQAAPVGLQGAVDEKLKHAQHSATKVEELLCDGPPDRGLPLEVGEDLWDIFPDGQDQLDVLNGVDLIINH